MHNYLQSNYDKTTRLSLYFISIFIFYFSKITKIDKIRKYTTKYYIDTSFVQYENPRAF